jgi:hypothetical protein
MSSTESKLKPIGINITIPDDLHRRVKACAAMEAQTLAEYVFDALTAAVDRDISFAAEMKSIVASLDATDEVKQ